MIVSRSRNKVRNAELLPFPCHIEILPKICTFTEHLLKFLGMHLSKPPKDPFLDYNNYKVYEWDDQMHQFLQLGKKSL